MVYWKYTQSAKNSRQEHESGCFGVAYHETLHTWRRLKSRFVTGPDSCRR